MYIKDLEESFSLLLRIAFHTACVYKRFAFETLALLSFHFFFRFAVQRPWEGNLSGKLIRGAENVANRDST